jgi:hypothetical protein
MTARPAAHSQVAVWELGEVWGLTGRQARVEVTRKPPLEVLVDLEVAGRHWRTPVAIARNSVSSSMTA